MKKNHLLFVFIPALLMACWLWLPAAFAYWMAALIAVIVISSLTLFRPVVTSITRWAKANPHKTQGIIAIMQLVLMALGLFVGYSLFQLGYEMPMLATVLFGTLLFAGFVATPFLPKRRLVAIPKEVHRHRMVYMVMSISAFMMMMGIGNQLPVEEPEHPWTTTLASIDQHLFSMASTPETSTGGIIAAPTVMPVSQVGSSSQLPDARSLKKAQTKAEKRAAKAQRKAMRKAKRKMRRQLLRQAFVAGSCGLAIVLIILLVITTCAGLCLLGFGVAGVANVSLGWIAGIIAGPVIAYFSIRGIINVAKWCKGDQGADNV